MTDSPYGKYVAGKDTVNCLDETPRLIQGVVRGWSAADFERSYAPGKWSARQLIVHLSHAELNFGARLRFTLGSDDYTLQPWSQEEWMRSEPDATAGDALTLYVAARQSNLALCRTLTAAQRSRPLTHPEYGRVDLEWLMITNAGHELHHLPQLQQIAAQKESRNPT